jgi:nitronate monooxygenase
MFASSKLQKLLNLRAPIVLAPMVGASTIQLTKTIAEHGGLALHGAYTLQPTEITELVLALKSELGNKPFGINLWVPQPSECAALEQFANNSQELEQHINKLKEYFKEMNLELPASNFKFLDTETLFKAQMEALLDARPPIISFIMGIPAIEYILRAKELGILLVGTATTVEEGVALEKAGFDFVVAAGSDGGGHRGTFLKPIEQSLVGTFSLVPEMADKLTIPVIASGGISDGRGIAAAMILGADAVQIGTAFLYSHESAIPEGHKKLMEQSSETVLTDAFSGRFGRSLPNRLTIELANQTVPKYPIHSGLMKGLQIEAKKTGNTDFFPLWAGQSFRLGKRGFAGDIFNRLVNEAQKLGC